MATHYAIPSQASDPAILPSIETFYRTMAANEVDGWRDGDGETMGAGWYAWECLPGCLPDGEPYGPYDSEAEALADMRLHVTPEAPRAKGYAVTVWVEGCDSQGAADAAVGGVLEGAFLMASSNDGNDPETFARGVETALLARTGPDGNVTMDVVPD